MKMIRMNSKITAGILSGAMALGLAGCATQKVAGTYADTYVSPDRTLKVEKPTETEADRVVVVDWTDRTLGEVSAPQWLKNLRRGNSDTFKQQWGMDNSRIVKVSVATGKTEATAQALSRAGFAYTQAAELNQKIIGRVGQGLNDVGQLEALYVAASETKADITGLREEAGFFQKVRVTNEGNGNKDEHYIYYTIYSMDKKTWDGMCKKYILDLMGNVDFTTETQKKIGALFTEIKEEADKTDDAKYEQDKKAYSEQLERIDASKKETQAGDTKDAQTKKAVQDAIDLESFLM